MSSKKIGEMMKMRGPREKRKKKKKKKRLKMLTARKKKKKKKKKRIKWPQRERPKSGKIEHISSKLLFTDDTNFLDGGIS